MIPATTNTEATSLSPSALLNLFTLDMTPIGVNQLYYFVDAASANYQSIVFNGTTYMAFPVEITDFGYDGQGSIVRPKLKVSNINGLVSNLLLQNQDLVGANVIYTRVFARFIDAVNFQGGVSPYTPDPTAAYAPETFFINQKKQENQQLVEWELSTAFEIDGRKMPSREMNANICSWRYRDPNSCGYNGPPIADVNNNLFSGPPYNFAALNNRGVWSATNTYAKQDYVTIFSVNQSLLNIPLVYVCLVNGTIGTSPLMAGNTSFVLDACSKTLAGCRYRFPGSQVLPFGGFPGITRAPGSVFGYQSVP